LKCDMSRAANWQNHFAFICSHAVNITSLG
jgi:hypothetical protein